MMKNNHAFILTLVAVSRRKPAGEVSLYFISWSFLVLLMNRGSWLAFKPSNLTGAANQSRGSDVMRLTAPRSTSLLFSHSSCGWWCAGRHTHTYMLMKKLQHVNLFLFCALMMMVCGINLGSCSDKRRGKPAAYRWRWHDSDSASWQTEEQHLSEVFLLN